MRSWIVVPAACGLAVLLLLPGATPVNAEETAKFQEVTVRPGDTLWSISQKYLKDPQQWPEIMRYNKLPSSDPTVALPGMTLKVPMLLIKEELRAADLVQMLNLVQARRRDSADWKDAELHMTLYRDDWLKTRGDSKAQVRFANGELLSFDQNTMAVLKPRKQGDADLELHQGEIATSKARVVTPTAKIVPQTPGTQYTASVRDDFTTKVSVVTGEATVEGSGKKVTVEAGFQTDVAQGQAPAPPTAIPDLPGFADRFRDLTTFEAPARRKPAAVVVASRSATEDSSDFGKKLREPAVGQPVKSFHVQASGTADFSRVLFDKYYEADEHVDVDAADLSPGVYWWRVAIVDLMGAEGKFAPAFQHAVR